MTVAVRLHRSELGIVLTIVVVHLATSVWCPPGSAQEKVDEQPVYKYTGNLFSLKFHRPSCKFARVMWREHVVRFQFRKQAIDAGQKPCRYCLPPDWKSVEAKIVSPQSTEGAAQSALDAGWKPALPGKNASQTESDVGSDVVHERGGSARITHDATEHGSAVGVHEREGSARITHDATEHVSAVGVHEREGSARTTHDGHAHANSTEVPERSDRIYHAPSESASLDDGHNRGRENGDFQLPKVPNGTSAEEHSSVPLGEVGDSFSSAKKNSDSDQPQAESPEK